MPSARRKRTAERKCSDSVTCPEGMITKLVHVDKRKENEKRIGLDESEIFSKEEATVSRDLKCTNDLTKQVCCSSYLENDSNDVDFDIVGSPGTVEPSDLQLAEYYNQIHSLGDIL